MKRIFIGTNILLDLVMKRHSFYQEAKRLFDYCDQRNIKTYISAISIATINYLLSKSYRKDEVKRIFMILLNYFLFIKKLFLQLIILILKI